MSQTVKVKIRAGNSLEFPAICVHCSRTASEQMPLKKRRGRLTRIIDVPLCDQCAAELRRKSGEEERLGRLGRFVAVLAGVLVLAAGYLLLPSAISPLLRLAVALVLGSIAGLLVLAYFQRRSLAAAHAEKLAILDSVEMTDFSWRATTFRFANDDFARRFTSINESRLMEAAGDGATER
jgi:hypothetical protein